MARISPRTPNNFHIARNPPRDLWERPRLQYPADIVWSIPGGRSRSLNLEWIMRTPLQIDSANFAVLCKFRDRLWQIATGRGRRLPPVDVHYRTLRHRDLFPTRCYYQPNISHFRHHYFNGASLYPRSPDHVLFLFLLAELSESVKDSWSDRLDSTVYTDTPYI